MTTIPFRQCSCMHCMRTGCADFEKQPLATPELPRITCVFHRLPLAALGKDKQSKRCIQCQKRGDTCETEVKNSETSKAIATGLESSRWAASVAPGTFASLGTAAPSGEASSSRKASGNMPGLPAREPRERIWRKLYGQEEVPLTCGPFELYIMEHIGFHRCFWGANGERLEKVREFFEPTVSISGAEVDAAEVPAAGEGAMKVVVGLKPGTENDPRGEQDLCRTWVILLDWAREAYTQGPIALDDWLFARRLRRLDALNMDAMRDVVKKIEQDTKGAAESTEKYRKAVASAQEEAEEIVLEHGPLDNSSPLERERAVRVMSTALDTWVRETSARGLISPKALVGIASNAWECAVRGTPEEVISDWGFRALAGLR
ncbi:hypothetical protein EsHS_00001264 [Epichloe bromicola]